MKNKIPWKRTPKEKRTYTIVGDGDLVADVKKILKSDKFKEQINSIKKLKRK